MSADPAQSPAPAPDAAPDPASPAPDRDHRGAAHGDLLARRAQRQSQWLALFFGFTVALTTSAVFIGDALNRVADEIRLITVAVAIAVLVFGALILLVYALRHRLFRLLRMPVPGTLSDVIVKLDRGLRSWERADRAAAIERWQEGAASLAAWLGWARLRTWMLGILVGTATLFALLLGEVIMLRQNELIAEQNAYLREQNRNIQSQISLERTRNYQSRRTELIAALYDRTDCGQPPCGHVASLRARTEAVQAFTELEIGRFAEAASTTTAELCATGAAAQRPLDLRHLDLTPSEAGSSEDAPAMEAVLRGWMACGVDLAHADLSRANLSGADLRRASLARARLEGVDLSGADLSRADLNAVAMKDGGLRGARLAGASLERAQLRGADFSPLGEGAAARPADLSGAKLRGAAMTGVDLTRADLRGADLGRTDLSDVDLSGADLTGAQLDGSTRQGITWTGATCPDGTAAAGAAGCEGKLVPRR